MNSLSIDLQISLVDDAARRVFRRVADQPDACVLCGDRFNTAANVRRNRFQPDVCNGCMRDKARGFGR